MEVTSSIWHTHFDFESIKEAERARASLKFIAFLDGQFVFNYLPQPRVTKRFLEYANFSWRKRANCATLAQYLRFGYTGEVSLSNEESDYILFKKFLRYDGRQIFVGDVVAVPYISKEKVNAHKGLIPWVDQALDEMWEIETEKHKMAKNTPLDLRSRCKQPLKSFDQVYCGFYQNVGDFHFATCVAINKDGRPLFLAQNGKNFGNELINTLPVYVLTTEDEIISGKDFVFSEVYLCY
jgi:hypothetical protein